ncbi:hypothetical protein [Curtobacterium luteum]|uniref:hypothetical protein n=1 Tax=Curtobacterium luteum TaxID=33881 RepID=UPI00381FEFB1
MKRSWSALVAIAVVAALAGCSDDGEPTPSESAPQQIAQEKHRMRSVVADIYAEIPRSLIASAEQGSTGSLISCRRGDQWAGHGELVLAEGQSVSQVFAALRASDAFDGWDLETDVDGWEEPRLTLVGDQESAVLLSSRDGGASIQVNSFSQCMTFADDFIPGGSY